MFVIDLLIVAFLVSIVRYLDGKRRYSFFFKVEKLPCITKDNVQVLIDGRIHLQTIPLDKAGYAICGCDLAAFKLAQTSLLSCIGTMDLDEIFENRDRINQIVTEGMMKANSEWCIKDLRYEIKDISPRVLKPAPKSTAHIKPLKDALAKAESQNAATLAEHMVNIIAQVGGAVAGEDGMVRMSMKCTCPYCNHISYSIEEATAHDAVCEKHPAVIRAMKAEADKTMLVELVEAYAKQYRDDSDCEWILKARATLARVKEEL